jgi:hypothetical protein
MNNPSRDFYCLPDETNNLSLDNLSPPDADFFISPDFFLFFVVSDLFPESGGIGFSSGSKKSLF